MSLFDLSMNLKSTAAAKARSAWHKKLKWRRKKQLLAV